MLNILQNENRCSSITFYGVCLILFLSTEFNIVNIKGEVSDKTFFRMQIFQPEEPWDLEIPCQFRNKVCDKSDRCWLLRKLSELKSGLCTSQIFSLLHFGPEKRIVGPCLRATLFVEACQAEKFALYVVIGF